MTPTEAARLLELPADATPEQIEARFLELRRRLEDKIARAPTPGLQAKYRDSLTEITTAFETLALAADSSALPVLAREQGRGAEAGDRRPETGGAATPPRGSEAANPKSRIENRKSGKEFAVVILVAVLVLGAGGWFVMKTRAENAEKARLAAEAKAEADRLAAEEKARLEQMTLAVRTQLAEAKIVWEVAEREERDAERRVSDLRSELRSLRDPRPEQLAELNLRIDSAQRHANWLRDYLVQHPFRLARARLEELLQARAFTEVETVGIELRTAREALEGDLASSRNGEGTVEIATNLPTLRWVLRDPLGREMQAGMGPARVTGLAFAPHTLELKAATIADETLPVEVRPGSLNPQQLDYAFTLVSVENCPPDTRLLLYGEPVDRLPDGRVPVNGPVRLVGYRAGYLPDTVTNEDRDPEAPLEFTWVPLSTRGLVDGYLARLSHHDAYAQVNLLADLETVLAASGLIPNARWLELFKSVQEPLSRLEPLTDRMSGYQRLLNELLFRDEAAARGLLDEMADLMEQLTLAQRLQVPLNYSMMPAWRLNPAAAARFGAAYALALDGNNNLFTLHTFYLSAGLTEEAARTREQSLARVKPEERAGRAQTLDNLAAQVRHRVDYEVPLRRALKLNETAAFDALVRPGIPESGTSPAAIAMWLWQDGLINQSLAVQLTNNYGAVPYWLQYGVLRSGRIDLLERFVEGVRVEDRFRNGTLAQAALTAALLGNQTKVRQFIDQLDAAHPIYLRDLGRLALAHELIGDRAGAQARLDALEKDENLRSQTWVGTLAEAFHTLRRQGDAARERRLLETINKRPADIEGLANWLWSGDREAAAVSLRRYLRNGDYNNLHNLLPYYLDWITLPATAGEEPPVTGAYLEKEGLILAHLTKAVGLSRPNAGRWPTPHLQSVPPTLKKRTPFYYPAAATRAGVGKGTAKIRITVGPDGKPRGYETVEATHQTLADELIGKAPAWEFFPALANGKPTTGTYEFTGTFTGN